MTAHVCWHRLVGEQGPYLYYECRCGSRRHGRRNVVGYFALDKTWLEGGEWGGAAPVTAPAAPSGQRGRKRR